VLERSGPNGSPAPPPGGAASGYQIEEYLYARPRLRAPKAKTGRPVREAPVAGPAPSARLARGEAALARLRQAAAARERAAVLRIVQLHGELKAREVELGRAKREAAEAAREVETLRAQLAATAAALAAASREAGEKEAVARAGIVALRRELAARGAALVYATRRIKEMACRMASFELDAIEAEAAGAALAAADD